MTVGDNVAYGLKMDGAPKDEIKTRTAEALALVRLDEFAGRFSHQLSGGQRQRVALARALVKRPRVLLLDEPLSALDAKLREAMQTELVKLQREVGITFVVVTHDQDEALSMAERIAVMESGKIRQLDTPKNLYEKTGKSFCRRFYRTDEHFARPSYSRESVRRRRIGRSLRSGRRCIARYVAVRPAYIKNFFRRFGGENAGGDNVFSAIVENISYYGGETVLLVRAEKHAPLSVILPIQNRDSAAPQTGEKITIQWRAEDMITLAE